MLGAALSYCVACCWLRVFYRDHKSTFVKFTLAGGLTTALGLGLYWVEVSQYDMNQYVVRPMNWPVITFFGLLLNWVVFREWKPNKRVSGKRWFAVALGCAGLSFSIFTVLTATFGVQYLLAQVVTAVVVGAGHFFSAVFFIFRPQPKGIMA